MAIFQHHTKKGYAKNRKIWRFHVARNWRQCHFSRISCPFTIVQKNDILQDKWINLKILSILYGVVLNPASASFTFLWPIASSKLKQLKQYFFTNFFILFFPNHFPALLLFSIPARNSTLMQLIHLPV